jgi:hypothetical protein
MKALTICQPWAWAIAAGHKLVENRGKPFSYRGPLAIHAGLSRTWLERERPFACEWPDLYGVDFPAKDELVFGAVVAVAELYDCVKVEEIGQLPGGRWASGPWCLLLRDIRKLPQPVPCKGQLGLWVPPALGSIPQC